MKRGLVPSVLLLVSCAEPASMLTCGEGELFFDEGDGPPRCVVFCDTGTGALCELDGTPLSSGGGGRTTDAPAEQREWEVAIGAAHVCVLALDGSVRCWGDDAEGQLGGAGEGEVVLTGADHITAGSHHTCARVGRSMTCWGRNVEGQCGAPATATLPPTMVDGAENVRRVSAAVTGTSYVTGTGELFAFGLVGQPSIESHAPLLIPSDLAVDTELSPIVLCTRQADGSAACTGSARVTGYTDNCPQYVLLSVEGSDPPEQLPVPSEIACAGGQACFLRTLDGEIWAWGWSDLLVLDPDTDTRDHRCGAIPLGALGPTRRIAAGAAHACVIAGEVDGTEPGHLRCWGEGPGASVPEAFEQALDVFASPDSGGTCVRTVEDQIDCWGTGVSALDR